MKLRQPRISTVLLVYLIGTVALVLGIAMVLLLRTYQRSLISNAETAGRRTIAQVSNTVDDYLDEIHKVMGTLADSMNEPDLEREPFFENFLLIRPDVIAVTTYDGGGRLVNCYSLGHAVRQDLEENLSLQKGWLSGNPDSFLSAPHVVTLFEGYYPWVVTVMAPMDAGGREKWVALDISCSNISAYINDVGIGQRGYCFLMDFDGNIVYHPQQQLIYSSLKSEKTDLIAAMKDGSYVEGNILYTVQTLTNGRWRVVGESLVQEVVTDSMEELTRIALLAVLVVLAATAIISAVLSRVLFRPIRDLASAMKDFERDADHFTYQNVGGAREVRALSESFDHMVGQIQNLVDTVRSEEINLRKTELRALQAQINPHFLYNTLDAISWMCEQGKNAEAVQMVNALARLFRISISRGHELIPIRSELQHAESYLQIQSQRYRGQFTYTFDADETCLDYLCNKITLQPIIENAIYHGLGGMTEDGKIRVSVESRDDDIVFTVEDNGAGMTEEQIDAIMSKERSDRAGIGIKNVNDRLKIYFGAAYGITIDSVPDEGTQVSIRMPKVREEAEYENR